MWLFDRRFALIAPLALAACGFQPVFAPGGTGSKLQGQILVAAPADRDGFLLVQRIEERLGRASVPAYTLSLNLQVNEETLGIDASGNTDRFNLVGVAGYALASSGTGDVLTSGTVNSFTGYSASGTTVETLAARRDARERLMIILGDQIIARLLSATLPE